MWSEMTGISTPSFDFVGCFLSILDVFGIVDCVKDYCDDKFWVQDRIQSL